MSYTYDAWGYHTVAYHNGGAVTPAQYNPFRYRGYYYDSDLGMYYLNARYYDPYTARFISMDGVEYLGASGDLNSYNLYSYCNNNPVMYADPSGHVIVSTLLIAAGIGFAVGFGATLLADYIDDGTVFNESIHAIDYITNSIVGAAAGAFIGISAPLASSFAMSGSAAAIPVSGVTVAAGAVVVGATILLASSNRPGDNKKQNQQFKDAMKELGVTNKDKMRRVHDKINGRNMGYNELIKFIKKVLNLG